MFLLPSAEPAKGSSAQLHRPLEHRIEGRSEIAGRGIDDLQYFGSRGLLSEGLVTLGSALGELANR
jgi:hypothetical protein